MSFDTDDDVKEDKDLEEVVDQVTSEQRRAVTCVAYAVGFEASSSSVVNRIGLYSEVRIDHPIRRLRLRPLV